LIVIEPLEVAPEMEIELDHESPGRTIGVPGFDQLKPPPPENESCMGSSALVLVAPTLIEVEPPSGTDTLLQLTLAKAGAVEMPRIATEERKRASAAAANMTPGAGRR
jgi:hypothetical protein